MKIWQGVFLFPGILDKRVALMWLTGNLFPGRWIDRREKHIAIVITRNLRNQ